MEEIKIIIGADLVPTENNFDKFKNGDVDYLLGNNLKKRLEEADIRIFNLEVPLTDLECPIEKCGPNLFAPCESIVGIKKINPSCLTLANNHILDQGISGIESTIKVLEQNRISHVGVGKNPDEAAEPRIIEVKNKIIGIYACAEHEFSIVKKDRIGANPFDTLESFEHVRKLKEKCDYVVVLYHGGKEYYRYPSPNLQRYCRKFIESGADLVVCQHSHCIGCKEEYNNGTIIYGQGNFLFCKSNHECWQTGMLIEVSLEKNKTHIDYIPIQKTNDKVRMADEENGSKILQEFYRRNEEISEEGFVENNYKVFAEKSLYEILGRNDFISKNFLFRVINKLSRNRLKRWYFEKLYLPKMKYVVSNTIECEAWNELLLCGLKLK